jgi:hypothetical protein
VLRGHESLSAIHLDRTNLLSGAPVSADFAGFRRCIRYSSAVLSNKEITMKTAALLLILCLGAVAAHAELRDSAFYISPRIGKGSIDIRQRANVSEVDDDADTLYLGVAGGWISPIGLLVEVGYDSQSNFDLFTALDKYTLEHTYGMIGYEIPLGRAWRLTPKVGRSKWSLQKRDGAFLHPGPEETKTIRGYQDIWEVELCGKVSDTVSLGAAYRDSNYDFGHADAIMFVAKFEF